MVTDLLDSFLIRALIAGCCVALIAAPFGCFVVWRRLAYFGDTLAHSALLGVVLGLWLRLDATLAVLLVCLSVAVLLFVAERRGQLSSDTLLGILSHSSLALGLVGIAFFETLRVDLVSYLFGDILSVTRADLLWIGCGGGLALALLLFFWKPLLALAVNVELARVEGLPVERLQLLFVVLLALVVALLMKVVGLILVTALLIIPAATAQRLARSPEGMALLAVMFGLLAVVGGLAASWYGDTPAGPSMVIAAAGLFLLVSLSPRRSA